MSNETSLPTDKSILTGAIVNGAINAAINGTIQFFLLRNHVPLRLPWPGDSSS